jgi:SAM-dependent methyltransferase
LAELLLGCGGKRIKHLTWEGRTEWSALTTLDINADHNPNVVHDLNIRPLPFEDDTFDEIHAYEVLEHIGKQGDWRSFFEEFSEYWRILKPGGVLLGTSPSQKSVWAWGDPGHTRTLQIENFVFLHQPSYTAQVGVTPMTDYRFVYKADFEPRVLADGGQSFQYILQAVKPSRVVDAR